jgi:hypothetical protein
MEHICATIVYMPCVFNPNSKSMVSNVNNTITDQLLFPGTKRFKVVKLEKYTLGK